MKNKGKGKIRELRRILGQKQADFAVTIGASKDTVVSWEIGRNGLSEGMARRIALATGVDERSLLEGSKPLVTRHPAGRPFTLEEYHRHHKQFWGKSLEENAPRHVERCADAVGLILRAAAQADKGRMAAVLDSFIQWCRQTREDFELGEKIDAQLEERKWTLVLNHTYAQWREMAKTDPDAARIMGFKDDPAKSGKENLRLEREMVPVWTPGHSMRGSAAKRGGN